ATGQAPATASAKAPTSLRALSNATSPEVSADASAAQHVEGPILHLQIVAKESGRPISSASIQYTAWSGDQFQPDRQLTADRLGVCDVRYPSNTTELQLTTQIEGFADTQLLWRTPNGDVIPTNYVLKVDAAVRIGGRVIDPDGNPVAGAEVGWGE